MLSQRFISDGFRCRFFHNAFLIHDRTRWVASRLNRVREILCLEAGGSAVDRAPLIFCNGSHHEDNNNVFHWCLPTAAAVALSLFVSGQPGHVLCEDSCDGNRLYPKDLERLLKPDAANSSPVCIPPPFPGLAAQSWSERHVASILGLPMRGKTYVSEQLRHYIQFFHGARAEVFKVGEYFGPDGEEQLAASLQRFFHAESSAGFEDPYSFECAQEIGLSSGGFAILLSSDSADSVNLRWSPHTKFHRRWIVKELQKLHAYPSFIQISVNAPEGETYIADLARVRGVPLEECKRLIEAYEDHYVPIQDGNSEKKLPYIIVSDYNQTLIANQVMHSHIGSSICHFLANLHPYKHEVYLSRHGESQFNVERRIGGDSSLSPRGEEYARRLGIFSEFVVCGHAKSLVCVTLSYTELKHLRDHLIELPNGICVKGDWSGYGDASGAVVVEGMRLVRMQLDYGSSFIAAPDTIDGVLSSLTSSLGYSTLVFVEGDLDQAGQVPARLWTSSLRRTIETAGFVPHPIIQGPDGEQIRQMSPHRFRSLDEVYAGEFDGLTEEQIKQRAPGVIADRKLDKLGFRYPRGESYYDIIARLDQPMSHLERIREPILLVSHQAVLRLILGWLTLKSRGDAMKVAIPQHEVIKISFDGLGGPRIETRYPLGPTRLHDDGQSALV